MNRENPILTRERVLRGVAALGFLALSHGPVYAQTADGASGATSPDDQIENQLQAMQAGEEIPDLPNAEIGYAGRAPWIGSHGIDEFDYALIMNGNRPISLVFQTDCARHAFQDAGTYHRTWFPGFADPHQRVDSMDIVNLVPAVSPIIPITEVERINYGGKAYECEQVSAKDDLIAFGKKIVKYLPTVAAGGTRTILDIIRAVEKASHEPADQGPQPTPDVI